MTNKEILKKQIIYRSAHRGSKEMDLLLGNFVKKYLNKLSSDELSQLNYLLTVDDKNLFNYYVNKKISVKIPKNRIFALFKNFKIK